MTDILCAMSYTSVCFSKPHCLLFNRFCAICVSLAQRDDCFKYNHCVRWWKRKFVWINQAILYHVYGNSLHVTSGRTLVINIILNVKLRTKISGGHILNAALCATQSLHISRMENGRKYTLLYQLYSANQSKMIVPFAWLIFMASHRRPKQNLCRQIVNRIKKWSNMTSRTESQFLSHMPQLKSWYLTNGTAWFSSWYSQIRGQMFWDPKCNNKIYYCNVRIFSFSFLHLV